RRTRSRVRGGGLPAEPIPRALISAVARPRRRRIAETKPQAGREAQTRGPQDIATHRNPSTLAAAHPWWTALWIALVATQYQDRSLVCAQRAGRQPYPPP